MSKKISLDKMSMKKAFGQEPKGKSKRQPSTVGPIDSKSMRAKAKKEKSKAPVKTITALVLKLFKVDPTIKSKVMIEKVKKDFPKSKFQLSHYSWYKYQIKNEKYVMPKNVLDILRG